MHYWKFAVCVAVVSTLHLSKITADESEVASERNGVEDEGSSSYASNEAVQYTDSYANYYATQWTPELYKQYGLPQDYFASQHAQRKPLRKQGFAQSMTDMLGEEAGIVLGTLGAILGSLAVVGVGINAGNVGSLSTDQDSICSAVKTLGAIDVSSASTTDTTTGTELNALITAIEAVATPSC